MKTPFASILLWAGGLIALLTLPLRADDPKLVDASYRHAPPEAYQRWQDLKYGLRIHWGIYSQFGIEASWPVKKMANDKKQAYFDSYRTFNPTEFDAEKWMGLFERCGLKCFAFTTKHHDGFSMFDTKTRVTRRINWTAPGGPRIEPCDLAYSIMETPLKRDIVRELCDAAHRHGIAVDLYFSHIDWYDADFRMDQWNPFRDKDYTPPADPPGFARFARRHREQIREILGNYGKVDMLCLDMALPEFCWPEVQRTVLMARQLQPEVLMRDRGIGAYGDYTTPENWIPNSAGLTDKRVERPWMVIHTLSGQFAYDPAVSKYKPGEWILGQLIDIVAKGGNFMPSIGPDAKGDFHPEAVRRLEYVGDWLRINGEAIYATRPWKFYKEGDDVRFTRSKDGRYVYAISLKWPGQTFVLKSPRASAGSEIRMLGESRPLRWHQDADGLTIQLPDHLQREQDRPCRQAYAFKIEIGSAKDVSVTVDLATVVNTMRGGMGASWHAIEEPIPYSDKPHPVFGNKSHGGSGWGAYPPAEDDAAWQQIDRHARWLGFDWNRVELEQRIYEPQRGQFSWDNPEMRILYRILDWCQRNKADVFLQQMWGNVRWNTFPEWRDDPAGRVHSGPVSMEDFGAGLATLVEHLVKAKGYTCIRWVCINNEPNGKWSWWQQPPDQVMPLKPGLAAVRRALDAKGIRIPISGPDLTGGVPPLKPERFDFLDLLGAYDFHSYNENFDWLSKGQMAGFDKNTSDWAAWAHQNHKPLFMSEFGTMANGWGADHPGPGSYESVLKDAELVIRRINAGVDGFNRWSFLNRGDLDGQWQFIDSWERKEGKLLKRYTPHPNTYFVLGLLSRFTAKHSDVLGCLVKGGQSGNWQRVFATALRSPKGNLTLAVVNDAKVEHNVSWELRGIAENRTLYRYCVDQTQRDRGDVRIDPQTQWRLSRGTPVFQDRLPPMSLTIYTTYELNHADDGVMAE